MSRKHLIIADTQVKPENNLDYIDWLGQYILDKEPDVVVNIGDWWDMPSLSSYDKGKKSFEGRRYNLDIAAGKTAMDRLWKPVTEYNEMQRRNKKKLYEPERHFAEGNHEHRIVKVTEVQPELDGTIGLKDLEISKWGWEFHPFLDTFVIDGVVYSHYFPSGVMGRACTSARSILSKYHQSAVCGHQQGRDIAYAKRADGTPMTVIMAGSYYEHEEHYLSPFTNEHWRGIYVLHEVSNGSFDEMPVSLNYLKRKYGT